MSLVLFKQENGREIAVNPTYVTHVEPVFGASFNGCAIHVISEDLHVVVRLPGCTVAEVTKVLNAASRS